MHLLLLLAAPTMIIVDTPQPLGGELCSTRVIPAAQAEGAASVRKLSEMPPANQVLTVYRTEDGCPKPVVVRRDIGVK